MALLSFIGSRSGTAGNGADISVSLSTLGLQENDLVVVWAIQGDIAESGFASFLNIVTSGYTEIIKQGDVSVSSLGAGFASVIAAYKFMGSTPDTTVVVNGTGDAGDGGAACVMAFRAINQSTPLDVAVQAITPFRGTGQIDCPSITTVSNRTAILACGAIGRGGSAGVATAAPDNYTDLITLEGPNEDVDTAIALCWRNMQTSGAEDPGPYVGLSSGSQSARFAVTIALRAADQTTQILEPGLLASSNAFHAPTVSRGEVFITPPLLASTAEIFSHDIARVVILTPNADVSDGNWTNESDSATDLFESVNENAPNDTDFIKSGSFPSGDIVKLGLSGITAGGLALDEPMVVRYRYRRPASAQTQIGLTVRLLEGSTPIASWKHGTPNDQWVTVSQVLTAEQYANITDFDDLFLEFEANWAQTFITAPLFTNQQAFFAPSVFDPGGVFATTMTSGNGFGGTVFGFIDDVFAATFGSISQEPISGEVLRALVGTFVMFEGDLVSELSGLTIWVGGVEYPFDGDDWTLDSDGSSTGVANSTYASWSSAGPDFSPGTGEQYAIEIK